MLDIGANIGWYSLLVASINPSSSIHSFEPIPVTFDRLSENCSLNKAESITCHNFGFSTESGSFPFYFYSEGSGNASIRNLAGREDAQVIECELRTLGDFCLDLPHSSTIDFIKCDVEGNELFVFQGSSSVLEKHKGTSKNCRLPEIETGGTPSAHESYGRVRVHNWIFRGAHKPILLVELLRKWCAPFGYHPNEVLELMFGLGYSAYGVNSRGGLSIVESISESTIETNFFFVHPGSNLVSSIAKFLPGK